MALRRVSRCTSSTMKADGTQSPKASPSAYLSMERRHIFGMRAVRRSKFMRAPRGMRGGLGTSRRMSVS